MDLGLYQQQSIKVVMTQELKQAIEILQFSKIELLQYIQEKAMENPLLELQEPAYEQGGGLYETGRKPYQGEYNPFDFISGTKQDLKEDLLQQARYLNLDEQTYKQLSYLIFQLAEDGYLPENVTSESAEELGLDVTEVEELLGLLQKLDPPGVGARNLRECLLLQIDRMSEKNALARTIVEGHLVDLAKKKWGQLSDKLSVSETEIRVAAQWIQKLQPKPGSLFETGHTSYIQPDLTIQKRDGRYIVLMNDHYFPRIRENRHYIQVMNTQTDKAAKEYVTRKRREINWLSKCMEQRTDTILKVVKVMIKNQKRFLDHGFLSLKPMTLRTVAEEIGIHESTVSRAIRNKYVQTPHGLLEMKAFFASKLNSGEGEEVSSSSVKWLIKGLVEKENVHKPLSDQKISDILSADHGISVSRRTVAKYRGQLHISSSSKRKA